MRYISPERRFWQHVFRRDFLAAQALALAAAALLLLFPKGTPFDAYVLAFGAEFVLPFCFLWLVLGRSVREYGLGWGKWGALVNGSVLLVSLGVFLSGIWLFFSKTSLGIAFVANVSPTLAGIRTSFADFLIYSVLSLWFVALNEFFFRGFFLFVWKKSFGNKAIVAHLVFFGAFLWLKVHELPVSTFEGSLILFGSWSFVASLIAFYTESVFLAFCFSIFSDILTTVFVIALS